jgi:hypothetical protein
MKLNRVSGVGGFTHSLAQADGVERAIQQSKRQEKWTLFNVQRKDWMQTMTLLYGESTTPSWQLALGGAVFLVESSREGRLVVSLYHEEDEVPDQKLCTAGLRFMGALEEDIETLQESSPAFYAKLSAFPADLYRKGGAVEVVEEVIAETLDEEEIPTPEMAKKAGRKAKRKS